MTSGSKTLGLIGLYRCGNLGDEAIWQAFAGILPELLPDHWRLKIITFGPGGFETAYLPNDPETSADLLHQLALDDQGARKVNLGFWLGTGWHRFLSALSALDGAWYAGGHWIHDLSLTTAAGVMLPLLWARFRGNNAGFVNVGAGPLSTAIGKRLTASAVKAKGPLVVRDSRSAEFIRQANVNRVPMIGADTAFLLEPAPEATIYEITGKIGLSKERETIGIVPCAWFKMSNLYSNDQAAIDKMITALSAQAVFLIRKGHAVSLIPTMLPEDEIICEKIMHAVNSEHCTIWPTRRFSAQALMGLVGKLRALITFRMHPMLFAYKMGTPFVALDYAPKVKSLAEDIGSGRWLIDLNGNWPAELEARVNELLECKSPYEGSLAAGQMKEAAINGINAAIKTLGEKPLD